MAPPPSGTAGLRSALTDLTPFQYRGAQSLPIWAFTGGFPDPAYFPAGPLMDCLAAAAGEDVAILQYGSDLDESLRYGEAGLRRVLLRRLAGDLPRSATIANVMLTNGGIGALELACKAFLDPGEVVVVEAPTWPVALTMARQHRAELQAVPVDAQGMRVEQLAEQADRLAAEGRRVKLVYTIPTFHTPTGTVLSVDRRRRLAELAARHDFIVLEDGTYEALRYEGAEVPSVQSFDTHGRVLKIGSFSKTVAPALRIGWIAGAADALTALAGVRTDLGVGQWAARALALFLERGCYDEHLPRLLAGYRRKRDVVRAALERECAGLADWSVPQGGYYFWLKLRDPVDAAKAKRIALERGIATRPGEQFFGVPQDGRQQLRVAFSQVPEDVIADGIAALAGALRASVLGARP